jgi:hypothetical protein
MTKRTCQTRPYSTSTIDTSQLFSTTGDSSLASGFSGTLHVRSVEFTQLPKDLFRLIFFDGTGCTTHQRDAPLTASPPTQWSRCSLSRAIRRRSRYAQPITLPIQSRPRAEHFFRGRSQPWSVQLLGFRLYLSKLGPGWVDYGLLVLERQL